MRANASDAAIKQALEYVKDLEALPLVNLRGLSGPDGVRNVTRIVKVVNQVFNNTLVYYEYGNEDDLSGMTADQYTANWNQIVPTIKQLAPQAQVMGPSTYRYDSHYLSTFLQKARPIPDAVSWHAYTCEEGTAKEQCLQHIHDWSQNADNARQVMQQVTGKTLPIMLTEWNYAPNATNNDGKSNDEDFMSKWTLQALQTLRSAQVYASMQFAATNSTTALINSDGTLTAQGLALQETYDNWSISGSTTPTTPAGTVTPTQGANQTPTPTPAQSPTATPKPGTNPTPAPTQPPAPPDPMQIYKQATSGQPLYSSSLAAQDGGKWDVVNNSNGGYCAFVNSSYHAYAPGQKSYTPCMSHVTYPADFAVQVEMTVREGEGG
ncbi:MAG: hypothetical protein J2P36_37395, partial [Ktedonobacteraceae bacterium]|nr:hypothetical protein [Ktedonobacteraceae bacterium]